MAILSKASKPDNFALHSSLKLSFKFFVDCESFLELKSPDILDLSETNLDEKTDYGNFSIYLLLIWKDSSTHMHCLAVSVKEGLSFARDLSLQIRDSADSDVFDWLYFSVLLLFPLPITFFIFMQGFWFYFIEHRWGSLYQPICCVCCWRL